MKLKKTLIAILCGILLITGSGIPFINADAEDFNGSVSILTLDNLNKLINYIKENGNINSDSDLGLYAIAKQDSNTDIEVALEYFEYIDSIFYAADVKVDNNVYYFITLAYNISNDEAVIAIYGHNSDWDDNGFVLGNTDFDTHSYHKYDMIQFDEVEEDVDGNGINEIELDYGKVNNAVIKAFEEWDEFTNDIIGLGLDKLGFESYNVNDVQNNNSDYLPMYRLYNPNSGEHFYTSNVTELNNLRKAGWRYEGIAWNAPALSDIPVYRLYNPNAGDHHYTTSASERDNLENVGWKYEGIGWYSTESDGQALYRLYNPNAKAAGSHHYTTSASERDNLVSLGWRDEGVAWYGGK
ncbi:MAG: hypothetical protein IJV15_04165 [Lachnospiraceae bacterium]|nr:hypothetical protein [Lachnospiraceae bacterium]